MTQDLDDNWYSLIEEMHRRTVIPIIGSALLEIPDGKGEGMQLYEAVARELRVRYGHPPDAPFGSWCLHDCIAELLAGSQLNVDKLRRATASSLATLTADCPLPQPLKDLAAIDAFDLYVSLTCDKLLFRSLHKQDPQAESFAFGIRSDTNSRPLDIPVRPRGKISYQLFGSSDNLLDFAIHEGDVLEYLFRLQSEQTRSIKILLGRLRSSNLLFIGCRFPDWLGRSLLRIVNDEPLPSKSTQEFMTEWEGDRNLSTFVSRFSPNSLVFPGTPAEFVRELSRRWLAAHSSPNAPAAARPAAPPPVGDGPLIFVSYASENQAAARRIADRLLELGAGDVWLDKKKLKSGDDWSANIDEAIRSCDYFMPLLSTEADARRQGVFWEEWVKALKHAEQVADAFLLPTLIDTDQAARQSYQRIGRQLGTDRFWTLHLTNAPAGVLDATAEDDLRERIATVRGR
jgi:hypothetical protein